MPTSPHSISICTPISGGFCKTEYTASVAATISDLERAGIRVTYSTVSGGMIGDQRDALAHIFLTKTECTHALFIDSDMQFSGKLAARLLEFDKPMIGAVYAKRKVDVAKLRSAADESLAYDFILRSLPHGVTVSKGLSEVAGLGFGFVLIRREVFMQLKERPGILSYQSSYVNAVVKAYFREMDLPNGGRLSEDYAFCDRWRDAGGAVWAYPGAEIKHIGDFAYGTRFLQYLRHMRAVTDKQATES